MDSPREDTLRNIVPVINLIDHPIDPSIYRAGIAETETGAVVEFFGIVRGTEDGQPIRGISYEAFQEMAHEELARIAADMIKEFALTELICLHRVGFVAAGETSVYLRVAASHRAEAFEASGKFIDRLKASVPIWKHPVGNE